MFVSIYLLSFILHFTQSTVNDYLNIKSGLDHISPDSMALRFFVSVKNTGEDCEVECMPDRCCLVMEGGEDCDILEIIGGCFENIPGGETRTVRLAAPLLNPYDRQGYCVVFIDSKPEGRGVFRNAVKIPFETTFSDSTIKPCPEVDQDPFNDCKPVDCETYYNGHRPYFDKRLQRCVKVPPCIDTDSENPIYDAKSNRCNRNATITNEDLNYIKTLSNGKDNRRAKDILIIKNKSPSYNDTQLYDKVTLDNQKTILRPDQLAVKLNNSSYLGPHDLLQAISKYFTKNVDAIAVLALLVSIQCCLILTMMYCMTKGCKCEKDKTIISRFFNYRQDVSVTTPLISNSNTETTCQFNSESSMNVDKKIKCYKACHKDKMHNAKFSMSDDILSKCVNRRDWTHKPKSGVIRELKPEEWNQIQNKEWNNNQNKEWNPNKDIKEAVSHERSKTDSKASVDKVKKTESKVIFENENVNEKVCDKGKLVKSIIKRNIDNVSNQPSSEKEIKVHSYDQVGNTANRQTNVRTVSLSTEKGAQAYFSNDSIDDFLSERGMIFLAGENVSKYTLSSDSSYNANLNKSSSEISGKTSKNNLVKNLISMIHRKSQRGPSSDPGGGKKNPGNLDLELIHMSQASVFSSNASELVDGSKKNTESRSSL